MALPKINSTPSYSVTVPSTGQEVTFRPFLVKEQKTLLIALETQERKDMVRNKIIRAEQTIRVYHFTLHYSPFTLPMLSTIQNSLFFYCPN